MNQRCFFSACGWIWGFLKTTYQESNVRGFAQDHLNIRRWMLYCHASLKEKKKKKTPDRKACGRSHFYFFLLSFHTPFVCVTTFRAHFGKRKEVWSFFPPQTVLSVYFLPSYPPPEVSVNEFTALPIMNL